MNGTAGARNRLEYTATKCDRFSALIQNGNHDPTTEKIVATSRPILSPLQESGCDCAEVSLQPHELQSLKHGDGVDARRGVAVAVRRRDLRAFASVGKLLRERRV